jgi:hypothetical protein
MGLALDSTLPRSSGAIDRYPDMLHDSALTPMTAVDGGRRGREARAPAARPGESATPYEP